MNRSAIKATLLPVLPLAWLVMLRLAQENTPDAGTLVTQAAFITGLLILAGVGRPMNVQGTWVWPWAGVGAALVLIVVSIVYVATANTYAAWGLSACIIVLSFWLDDALSAGFLRAARIGVHLAFIAAAAACLAVLGQIETRFSDEEFFVVLQVAELAIFVTLLWLANHHVRFWPYTYTRGLRFRRSWIGLPLIVVGVAGTYCTLRAYQTSFNPPDAPAYAGISREQPFLCGTVPVAAQVYDGKQVFAEYMALLAQKPLKTAPELGMLSLGTGEDRWAQAFRQALLADAAQGRYTGASNSIKYGQAEAALRVYYYLRVKQRFPNLFTSTENQRIQVWLVRVNQAAYQVGWVDWLYAVALGQQPSGPYGNQEIGAGLISLMQQGGWVQDALGEANRVYLHNKVHGWVGQFRNTDDTFVYQTDWINNKYYQVLSGAPFITSTTRLSFDWLLLQALPDGRPFGYNHPDPMSLAGAMYLGAGLLQDPHLMWLAGRETASNSPASTTAQPGVEGALSLQGQAPTQGSCLLYGDTGVPGQVGPLGPDKIVFRDGWEEQSQYLLLNLRFTGWHRYKATNTVTLVYQQEPLATDDTDLPPSAWLPAGRSAFRDKRIPRENLNGLVVSRTGMDAVLHQLLGGSLWAQDPPYFAQVEQFDTSANLDQSTTVIRGWHGWTQTRQVFFYHAGPIVLIDKVSGPPDQRAAIRWHMSGSQANSPARFTLREGAQPAEMALVPLGPASIQTKSPISDAGLQTVHVESQSGELQVATVFLTGEWAGAPVSLGTDAGNRAIRIGDAQKQITLRLTDR